MRGSPHARDGIIQDESEFSFTTNAVGFRIIFYFYRGFINQNQLGIIAHSSPVSLANTGEA